MPEACGFGCILSILRRQVMNMRPDHVATCLLGNFPEKPSTWWHASCPSSVPKHPGSLQCPCMKILPNWEMEAEIIHRLLGRGQETSDISKMHFSGKAG